MSNPDTTAPRRFSVGRILGAVAIVLFVLILIIVAIFNPFGWKFSEMNLAGDRDDDSSTSETATPLPTPTAEECAPEYVQVAVKRDGSEVRAHPEFENTIRPLIEDHEPIQVILDAELRLIASDAQYLAYRAAERGHWEDANNWEPLVEGGKVVDNACLTEEGKAVFNQLKGDLKEPGAVTTIGQADPTDRNSAITDGKAVVDEEAGLRGDLLAIITTYEDGTQTVRLVRCGNLTFDSNVVPTLPPGKTDNPPRPEEPEKCLPPTPYGTPETGCKDTPDDAPGIAEAPAGAGASADRSAGEDVGPLVQPSAAPYVAPAPVVVAPAPAPGPSPEPVPTLDPVAPPPPPLETAEPTNKPNAPGCVPAPGVPCP